MNWQLESRWNFSRNGWLCKQELAHPTPVSNPGDLGRKGDLDASSDSSPAPRPCQGVGNSSGGAGGVPWLFPKPACPPEGWSSSHPGQGTAGTAQLGETGTWQRLKGLQGKWGEILGKGGRDRTQMGYWEGIPPWEGGEGMGGNFQRILGLTHHCKCPLDGAWSHLG